MVCFLFIGIIDITIVSILIKNHSSISRNLTKRTKLHPFLKIGIKLRLKNTRGPTWHFWMITKILTPQNIGWRSATGATNMNILIKIVNLDRLKFRVNHAFSYW